ISVTPLAVPLLVGTRLILFPAAPHPRAAAAANAWLAPTPLFSPCVSCGSERRARAEIRFPPPPLILTESRRCSYKFAACEPSEHAKLEPDRQERDGSCCRSGPDRK